MTTSTVSPCSSELSGQDVQTLRDFALAQGTPYEWRQLLTACADYIDDHDEDRKPDPELADLREWIDVAKETSQEVINKVKGELKAFADKKLRTNADVTDLKRVIEDALEDLAIAMEP